jgi:predicted secreted protein
MKKWVMGAIIALGLGSVFAPISTRADAAYALIQADKDGKTITVKKGTPVEVRLAENLSTGYHWNVFEIRGKNIHLVREQHAKALRAMPGAGGNYEAFFSTTARGTSTIELRYERPTGIIPPKNKINAAPGQAFTITVIVN